MLSFTAGPRRCRCQRSTLTLSARKIERNGKTGLSKISGSATLFVPGSSKGSIHSQPRFTHAGGQASHSLTVAYRQTCSVQFLPDYCRRLLVVSSDFQLIPRAPTRGKQPALPTTYISTIFILSLPPFLLTAG